MRATRGPDLTRETGDAPRVARITRLARFGPAAHFFEEGLSGVSFDRSGEKHSLWGDHVGPVGGRASCL
jgi:hypothetical protein